MGYPYYGRSDVAVPSLSLRKQLLVPWSRVPQGAL